MDYLVTGGCGFIGSHLTASLLKDGHSVIVLDNLSSGSRDKCPDGATLIEGDIRDEALVTKLMADMHGCFHLAAVASVDKCNNEWVDSHTSNLTGTINIFNAAKDADGVPVIYASSAATYGDNPDLPLNEQSDTTPLTSYGLDKLSCEHYGRIAWDMHGVPNVGLRFFNVFGPGQNPDSQYSGVITAFMTRILNGESISIHGDGQQTRDFIYIDDIVALLRAAMDYDDKQHLVCNGCTGHSISINALVDTIESITEKTIDKKHDPARPGDIKHSCGNPNYAKEVLGFTASTSFNDGMKALLDATNAERAA